MHGLEKGKRWRSSQNLTYFYNEYFRKEFTKKKALNLVLIFAILFTSVWQAPFARSGETYDLTDPDYLSAEYLGDEYEYDDEAYGGAGYLLDGEYSTNTEYDFGDMDIELPMEVYLTEPEPTDYEGGDLDGEGFVGWGYPEDKYPTEGEDYDELDLPEDGYVGIEPLMTFVYNVIFTPNIERVLNFITQDIFVSNPELVYFRHQVSHVNPDESMHLGLHQFTLREGLSISHNDMLFPFRESHYINLADFSDPLAVPRGNEGFYTLGLRAFASVRPGEIPPDGATHNRGEVFINFQETASFVEIRKDGVQEQYREGACDHRRSGLCDIPGRFSQTELMNPNTFVLNPTEIRVGRPTWDTLGEYVNEWEIKRVLENGELAPTGITGTGTDPIDVTGLNLAPGHYVIVNTVTELTPIIPEAMGVMPGTRFPGHPESPYPYTFIEVAHGAFEILESHVNVFHIDEYGQPLLNLDGELLRGTILNNESPVLTNRIVRSAEDFAFHEGIRISTGIPARDFYRAKAINPSDIAPFYVLDRIASSATDLPEGFTIDNEGVITNNTSGYHAETDLNIVFIYRRVPELSIRKVVNDVDVYNAEVGDSLTYTITVTNHSPFSVFSYRVIDDMSELVDSGFIAPIDGVDVTVDSIHVPVSVTTAGNILEVLFGELEGGEVVEISFDTTVELPAAGESFVNTAILRAPDGGEQDDAAEVDVTEPDDPTLEKSADVEIQYVDEEIVYTLTVYNPNRFSLRDFVVVDRIRTDLIELVGDIDGVIVEVENANGDRVPVLVDRIEFNPITDPNASENHEYSELRVYLADLVSGNTYVSFTAIVLSRAAAVGQIPNIAILYGPEDEDGNREEFDRDDELVLVPRLGITKQINGRDDVVTAQVDDVLRYTIVVTNYSSFPVLNHRVIDDLNLHNLLTYLNIDEDSLVVDHPNGAVTISNGIITADFSQLGAGESAMISFNATVRQAAAVIMR